MAMESAEGVIKYALAFTKAAPPRAASFAAVEAWRRLLFRLGLIGQDERRYGGLAYGNVSIRVEAKQFLISGSQTGGRCRLGPDDYCLVTDFDVEHNCIAATGWIPPSSEALTHAAAYQARPSTGCVLHVHCPELWRAAERQSIPTTPKQLAYGTPELAQCLIAMMAGAAENLFALGGHEDGLIAVGATAEAAAWALIRRLPAALILDGKT